MRILHILISTVMEDHPLMQSCPSHNFRLCSIACLKHSNRRFCTIPNSHFPSTIECFPLTANLQPCPSCLCNKHSQCSKVPSSPALFTQTLYFCPLPLQLFQEVPKLVYACYIQGAAIKTDNTVSLFADTGIPLQ